LRQEASVEISRQAACWIGGGIFAVTYVGLALGRVPGLRMDRAAIAFAGAAAMLATGVVTFAQATSPAAIDYETVVLLLGMMIVVGALRLAGVFAQLTRWAAGRITRPRGLLLATVLLSGLLSAFLVNDIVCLALAPLVLHLARRLDADPLPQVVGLATAANVGSMGTITGNPQNMIVGVQSHISYLRFAARLLPVALLGLAIDFLVVAWIYRRRLAPRVAADGGAAGSGAAGSVVAGRDAAGVGAAETPAERPRLGLLRRLRRKSVGIAAIAVVLFASGLPLAVVAAAAAAAVLAIGGVKPRRLYEQVDWSLLVLFAGLFVVVHAFQLEVLSQVGATAVERLAGAPIWAASLGAAALSNLVSNVPAVLLFAPAARVAPAVLRENAWLTLAMASTFAGNLTLLGSVANLIVVESARRDGVRVSFWEYCRAGVPVTLLTLALGIAWLTWTRY
jgi:Na+/H+ antiporter NhaD/arsenite permease-like protein